MFTFVELYIFIRSGNGHKSDISRKLRLSRLWQEIAENFQGRAGDADKAGLALLPHPAKGGAYWEAGAGNPEVTGSKPVPATSKTP